MFRYRKYFLSFDNKNNFFFKICTLDNVFIGTLTCYINKIHNHANIGLLIGDKANQGQGFGLDAWNSAIKYLFKVKKIRIGPTIIKTRIEKKEKKPIF